MTAAINMQCIPTPDIFDLGMATGSAPAVTGLAADPTGDPIQADGGGILQPDK